MTLFRFPTQFEITRDLQLTDNSTVRSDVMPSVNKSSRSASTRQTRSSARSGNHSASQRRNPGDYSRNKHAKEVENIDRYASEDQDNMSAQEGHSEPVSKRKRIPSAKAKAAREQEDWFSDHSDEYIINKNPNSQSRKAARTSSSSKKQSFRPADVHPASLVRLRSPLQLQSRTPPPRIKRKYASYRDAVSGESASSGDDNPGSGTHVTADMPGGVATIQSAEEDVGSLADFIDDRAEDELSIHSSDSAEDPPKRKSKSMARRNTRRLKSAGTESDTRPSKRQRGHGRHTEARGSCAAEPILISDSDEDGERVYARNSAKQRISPPKSFDHGASDDGDRVQSARASRGSSNRKNPNHQLERYASSSRRLKAEDSGYLTSEREDINDSSSRKASQEQDHHRVRSPRNRSSKKRRATPEAPAEDEAGSDVLLDWPPTPQLRTVRQLKQEEFDVQIPKKSKGKVPAKEPIDIVLLPGQDAMLAKTYSSLEPLKKVELFPLFSTQDAPEEEALKLSQIIRSYKSSRTASFVQERLMFMVTFQHKGVYVNPSRAKLDRVTTNGYGTSTYFVMPESVVQPRNGALPYHACFLMTGVCAYSKLFRPASKTSNQRTTVDHRIGLYPIEFEYQRAMTYLANVTKKPSLRYSFTSGILAFSTKPEGSSDSSKNFGASPTKSSFHNDRDGPIAQTSIANPLLEHFRSSRFPGALTYDDVVPIFDARGSMYATGPFDLTILHTLPLITADVEESSVVTVGFTGNTYLSGNGNLAGHDLLSLNIHPSPGQFSPAASPRSPWDILSPFLTIEWLSTLMVAHSKRSLRASKAALVMAVVPQVYLVPRQTQIVLLVMSQSFQTCVTSTTSSETLYPIYTQPTNYILPIYNQTNATGFATYGEPSAALDTPCSMTFSQAIGPGSVPRMDAWMYDTYWTLPVLQSVNIIPHCGGNPPMLDTFSASTVRSIYSTKPNKEHLTNRLFDALTVTGFDVYRNPSRVQPDQVESVTEFGITYFRIPRTIYELGRDAPSRNACFLSSGLVSYSHLVSPYNSTNSYRSIEDRRIGIYPIEYEYQRGLAYIGTVANKSTIKYAFGGEFSDRTFSKGITGNDSFLGLQNAGDHNDAIFNVVTQTYPHALNFSSFVPVFDAREPGFVFNKINFQTLLSLKMYEDEVPQGAFVTIMFAYLVPQIASHFTQIASCLYGETPLLTGTSCTHGSLDHPLALALLVLFETFSSSFGLAILTLGQQFHEFRIAVAQREDIFTSVVCRAARDTTRIVCCEAQNRHRKCPDFFQRGMMPLHTGNPSAGNHQPLHPNPSTIYPPQHHHSHHPTYTPYRPSLLPQSSYATQSTAGYYYGHCQPHQIAHVPQLVVSDHSRLDVSRVAAHSSSTTVDRAHLPLLHPVATATQQPSRVRVQEAAPTSELLGSSLDSSFELSIVARDRSPPSPCPDCRFTLMRQLRSAWTLRKILQCTPDTEERFA
ncbi:hypothetical protein NMY22_g16037 [Coprinellus aureogranulatus]|nr:hypothetical protein NMY22_g16037 [Coprinellus aureogranulatus]